MYRLTNFPECSNFYELDMHVSKYLSLVSTMEFFVIVPILRPMDVISDQVYLINVFILFYLSLSLIKSYCNASLTLLFCRVMPEKEFSLKYKGKV